MATYFDVIIYSLAGGLISLIGGVLLLSRESLARKTALYATPFAAGALLSAVFLDLLPEGIESEQAHSVLLSALGGVILFFLAERFLMWFHHHHSHDEDKKRGASLIIAGDTLHNALDGVAIAAAFLVSVPTGIITTIAVAAHEIPQEIGDFGLLLKKGLSRKKVLIINVLSALATVVAAVSVFSLGDSEAFPVGPLLGLSAGFLLYIALSDIIPEIHENSPGKRLLDWQTLMLLLGVGIVGLFITLAHGIAPHDHDSEHSAHSEEAGHSHEEDHHGEEHDNEFEYESHEGLPSVEVSVVSDPAGGYNVFAETENFTFTPQKTGQEAVAGEGHAHLYVNDEKYGRMYGNAIYVEDLKPGDEVKISLYTNDHLVYTHDDFPISSETVVK